MQIDRCPCRNEAIDKIGRYDPGLRREELALLAGIGASWYTRLWYLFTKPQARTLFVDWQGDTQRALALFRASTGRYVGERWFTTLVKDL